MQAASNRLKIIPFELGASWGLSAEGNCWNLDEKAQFYRFRTRMDNDGGLKFKHALSSLCGTLYLIL